MTESASPAAAALPKSWEDRDDQWTQAIDAAHPIHSGAHKQYATALEMVGNRHSKGALVELVCWLLQRASSPVAPVGAPTRRIDAYLRTQLHGYGVPREAIDEVVAEVSRILSRPGCELATDATTQLREHGPTADEAMFALTDLYLALPPKHAHQVSVVRRFIEVHLAATPIDQDFRRRPASSEAAPSAEGQE